MSTSHVTPGSLRAPLAHALYDPDAARDACGFAFVATLRGTPGRDIVDAGLTALLNLDHRGAVGAEEDSGDGAGILIQMPHKFLADAAKKGRINLPDAGQYGCGLVFLPRNPTARRKLEEVFGGIVQSEGQILLGWRTVPTNNAMLGDSAKASEPFIRQVFIGRDPSIDAAAFERKLYVIRKRAYNEIRAAGLDGGEFWYQPSLSARTIVYKGMLLTTQLKT